MNLVCGIRASMLFVQQEYELRLPFKKRDFTNKVRRKNINFVHEMRT